MEMQYSTVETANSILRAAAMAREDRAVGEHACTIQIWYRARLALQRRRINAVVHIQALCRGVLCRGAAHKSCCGSRRKAVLHEIMNFMDQESGMTEDRYVSSFSQALELVADGMEVDDAVACIVVTLHKTRRKKHSTSWQWVKHCLVPMLRDAKVVREKFEVHYRHDKNRTPFLVMSCPKGAHNKAKRCGILFKISDLVCSMRKLAAEAGKYPDISAMFEQVACQLVSAEMDAMHILAPHRVTMCPGSCVGNAGMIVPESVVVRIPSCGVRSCHSCPLISCHQAVRVMTCPHGCLKENSHEQVRWCLECGGDHAADARCDHRARWTRLPAETKEYLEGKIAAGEAQHCPECFAVQEKSGGCDKLRCPECGTKFCLKCGDVMGNDYVTDHLFALGGGGAGNDSLICRRTVVQKAFAGEARYVQEVVAAYQNGHGRVVADVHAMAQDVDLDTVPGEILALLPALGGGGAANDNAGGNQPMGQIEMDAILAAQMMQQEAGL